MECKEIEKDERNLTDQDLIDTLWNVKFEGFEPCSRNGFRFNRYIVECKGAICIALENAGSRFNRYIVECKGRLRRY